MESPEVYKLSESVGDWQSPAYREAYLIGCLLFLSDQTDDAALQRIILRQVDNYHTRKRQHMDAACESIRKKIRDYMPSESSLTLSAFVGMLETGEANLADFEACGVDLEAMARRYGSANCWTGTSGTRAAMLLKILEGMR